ncbi:MAG: LicD family protein [Erysipelotrichaceae bacterium]
MKSEEYILKTDALGNTITLKNVHDQLLEIMKVFHQICVEHEISYFLVGGSLLGAVRHQGFIPWDDDMDVAMMLEDYEKLLRILPDYLPAGYSYQCFDTHKAYNVLLPSMKFRKTDTYVKEANTTLKHNVRGEDGLFLDVFIFDYCNADQAIDQKARRKNYLLAPFIWVLENIGYNPQRLKRRFIANARGYGRCNQGSKYVGYDHSWVFYDPRTPIIVEKDDVFPLVLYPFEDTAFYGIHNPKALLDLEISVHHMSFPPVEEQKPKHIIDIVL